MEKLFDTLVAKLRKGIVSFVYKKKDGTERHACGTLYGIGHTIKGNSIHHHSKFTLAYYDVDCKGWRSFLIDNLIEVGELRKGTIAERHDICLALVVKLKEKMKKDGVTAFAYRKVDVSGRYFVYFDADKGEERKFRIDAFIGIGEPEDLEGNSISFFDETSRTTSSSKTYNDCSTLGIKSILAKRGVAIEDTENFMVIDLLPELNKAQLKDLICKATERLASL